jgi:hypothetical protein
MATGGGGTIGAANIELGVDTSKLDAGMAAAKSSVQSQTASMETIAANLGGDEEQYQGALAAQEELRYREQLAELSRRTQSETTTALLEQDAYQKKLFEIGKEKRDAEEAALAEQTAYETRLREMRKAELTDRQQIANVQKQSLQTQQQTTTATKETAAAVNEIAKNGQQVGGPNAFTKFFNDDLKEATKLFAAFGKLAIFKQVAMDAYNLGQAIREFVIGHLTTGAEEVKKFSENLLPNDTLTRVKAYQSELDTVNAQMALLSETDPFAIAAKKMANIPLTAEEIDGTFLRLQGVTMEKLKDKQKELNDLLKPNLDQVNAIAQREIEAQRDKRREMVESENLRLQMAGAKTEADKLDLKFREDLRQLNKRIDAEKDDATRQSLEQQKQLLYQNYRDDIDAFQQSEQEKADADYERQRGEKERERERRDERLQNIRDENEAARIALIEDPRQRAEEEFQANKRRLEKEIAAETDQATKYALQGKMQLLEATHQQTLRNIDREAQEERKAQNELAAEQARQVQEQFAQLRGEINSLFNAGNIEVGINRLGSLLEVLIQKTGDGR